MTFCGGVLVAIVIGVAAGTAQADALDKPAFTATPQELLAISAAAPPGDWPFVVLREDHEITADEHGRFVYRLRTVAAVRTQDGVEAWSTLQDGWYPAYQEKVQIRARAIAPSGAVVPLAPARLEEESREEPGYHTLLAELPPLEVGSIVEYELLSRDRAPVIAAGGDRTVNLGSGVPTWSTRVRIAAPVARRATVFAHNLPAGRAPRRTIEGGRDVWSLALGALAPNPDAESSVPGDATARPYLGITTAPSWNAVARAYREQIDRRIAEGPVTLPAELPRTATLATAGAIAAWQRSIAGSSGVQHSVAAVRATPAEILRRGEGDSHDLALLLVALLRRTGLRADVGLVLTGPGRDVDPELPGIDRFDHALVRVVIGGRDVWICPMAGLTPAGTLPSSEQGRRALIAADDTTGLVVTPVAAPADNLVREVRIYRLGESARTTTVTEIARASGAFSPAQRAWLRDGDPAEIRERLAAYVKDEYAGELVRYTASDPRDLDTPFTLTIDAARTGRVFTARDKITVWLFPADVLDHLPAAVTDEDASARRNAFQWERPHVMEIENRLVVPPGYTMPALPDDVTTQLGPATLTERHRLDGGRLVVTFRFDSGKRRLTPVELAALRAAVAEVRERTTTVVFEHTGWALASAGKPKQAIAEMERLIRLHPTEAQHHGELAYAYMEIGMGAAARRAAQRGVALEPSSADAHVVLAWALRHDTLGRDYGFDHDRAGALAALAKARALDPTHIGAAGELGDLLARNARGMLYGPGAELARAIDALRAAHELDASDERKAALDAAIAAEKRAPPRPPALREPARLPLERMRLFEDPVRAELAFWDAETVREIAAEGRELEFAGRIETLDMQALAIQTSGGPRAWRIEVKDDGDTWRLYAALDRGVAKIIASDANMQGLGRHALRLVARNDLAAAAQVLDWVLADASKGAKAGALQRFMLLWGPGLPRNRDAIELAAALAAQGTATAQIAAIGKRCSSTVTGAQQVCDYMTAAALRDLGRWAELEAHATAAAARGADPLYAVMWRVSALMGLDRYDDAARLCDANPDHPALLRSRAWIDAERKQFAAAVRRYDAILLRRDANADDRNNAAWLRLFTGTDLATGRVLVRQAIEDATGGGGPERIHTLAAIEAELGDLHAAKVAGWEAMEVGRRRVPEPSDWYVIGRIAEQLGLRDDAIAAYRRAAPAQRLPDETSAHRLAQRRLAALGALAK